MAVALAALNMGEALILTLIEKGILSREDALLLIANAREAKQLHAAEHGSKPHDGAGSILSGIENSLRASKER